MLVLFSMILSPACDDDRREKVDVFDAEVDAPDADTNTDTDTDADAEESDATNITDTADALDTDDTEVSEETDVMEIDVGDSAEAEVAVECSELGEVECLESNDCVLVQTLVAPFSYICRSAANECERISVMDQCVEEQRCTWYGDTCYCPPTELCACGGGIPWICRRTIDDVECGIEQPYSPCVGDTLCCADEGQQTGVCETDTLCGSSPCVMLVQLVQSGGHCEYGECRREMTLRADGYVFVSDNTPNSPRDTTLPPETLDRLKTALSLVDMWQLADEYGQCCAAHSDGTDHYVTFFQDGEPTRLVRVSEWNLAPENLQELITTLSQEASDLLSDPNSRPATCPGPAALPITGETPSCEATWELEQSGFRWELHGPAGETINSHTMTVEGFDLTMPATFQIRGIVTDHDYWSSGAYTITSPTGEPWQLAVTNKPAGALEFCLVVGMEVTLTIRIDQAFEGYLFGLAISGERGLMFVVDSGLVGVHEAQSVPFTVATATGDCPQETSEYFCNERGARILQFSSGGRQVDLLTGQWGRLPIQDGYDLALFNVRSFSSGYCDDSWNYAYVGYAMAGSDDVVCGGR